MSNSYFQFKQFTVCQQKAAMKVCTDACLFGAWVADTLEGKKIENVLDIGTGTGLLSLMLAQKIDAKIIAVEIDEAATEQAKENFEQSPFKERLTIIGGDIRKLKIKNCFDLIISNPPFFDNDLKGEDQRRNIALHSTALNFEDLLNQVIKLLNPSGLFAVLLPFTRSESFILSAEKHKLFLLEQMHVKQTEEHPFFRSMLLFSTSFVASVKTDMIIKNGGIYSEKFIRLLKDYYLYL
jgi:tRNA1Val (adenine37-N6)-methyltransferase